MTATPDISTTAGKIADLQQRLAEARIPVGEDAVRAIHDAEKLTARERIEALLDEGSFTEIDALARHRSTAFKLDKTRPLTDGVVSGYGTIDGRAVCVFSQDSSIFDGQLGEVTGEKIVKVLEMAVKSGTPVIGFYDGLGTRDKEGIVSLEMYSKIYRLQAQGSGVIPQIAIVAGEVAGSQAHGVALSDLVIGIANQGSVRLNKEDAADSIADATSGLSHLTAADEHAAMDLAAELLDYLPSNNRALAPRADDVAEGSAIDLDSAIPDERDAQFDMKEILSSVVDEDSLLELQPVFAPSVITSLARVAGIPVGIIANQPLQDDAWLDIDSAEKLTRFTRFCNTFNLPLVSFVDAPGFHSGESSAATTRRTTKLFASTADATVGKISVVVRRAFGSAYLAMAAKRMGTDLVFAWPTAQISTADAATLSAALGKDEAELEEMLVNPYAAAERGLVDAVIPPSQTRKQVIDGLRLLERKVEDGFHRKHNNMAL